MNEGLVNELAFSSEGGRFIPATESLTKANIIDYIIECGRILDEADVPEDDRLILLWIPEHRKKRIRKKWFNKRYPFFRGIKKNFL